MGHRQNIRECEIYALTRVSSTHIYIYIHIYIHIIIYVHMYTCVYTGLLITMHPTRGLIEARTSCVEGRLW